MLHLFVVTESQTLVFTLHNSTKVRALPECIAKYGVHIPVDTEEQACSGPLKLLSKHSWCVPSFLIEVQGHFWFDFLS